MDNTPAEDSFQVTLPSNACSEFYPDNKAQNFKIKLMRPIQCAPPSEWEFALVDVQFPHNWPNILETSELAFFVELQQRTPGATKPPGEIHSTPSAGELDTDSFEISIREAWYVDTYYDYDWTYVARMTLLKGHYTSIVELGQMIQTRFNQLMAPLQDACGVRVGVEFTYDRASGIAHFQPTGPVKIHFGATTKYILETIFAFPLTHTAMPTAAGGAAAPFKNPEIHSYCLPLTSRHECELEHLSAMYIYSNIAQYQLIGGTAAQLLAIVPIESSESELRMRGQQQFYTLNPPYYMPVPKGEIQDICIQLNTDWGAPFPFAETGSSKVRCRLHFRKRHQNSTSRLFL